MCLILFAYNVHPTYKLIVAANRDEFYRRKTAPAHFWEDHPEILAGRDLEKMGTWMGVTKNGRFAAVTNYRDPKEVTDGKLSRGELILNYLKSSKMPENYMKVMEESSELYPGYNLLVGSPDELYYFSNITKKSMKIEPGIHGVSNHLLNTEWPKVVHGKENLFNILTQKDDAMIESLFKILQNNDVAPDDRLPKTGVTIELERLLSSIFIKSEGYGTRSSTVLFMNDDEIIFNERVYNGADSKDQQFIIEIS
ncbi:NRDE family protein [Schinkia azotoformans]|uniref:NRDE family protein n=1 Tax=Schinkia azotoformans TaxID=1454 RepID=UPI002DB57899|nr:NRDE family protein [Schinkia azotoformans]MEC1715045.1 NRDE family protein [Schinkia azotoformans]MEC1745976.1 NRDE family protein [Schinkia azotoformans]MEC1758370.1 NRDE family protein [Schinkia azotoformans]MED4377245.1 NRDE family protein [Schinkia azotoformans]